MQNSDLQEASKIASSLLAVNPSLPELENYLRKLHCKIQALREITTGNCCFRER